MRVQRKLHPEEKILYSETKNVATIKRILSIIVFASISIIVYDFLIIKNLKENPEYEKDILLLYVPVVLPLLVALLLELSHRATKIYLTNKRILLKRAWHIQEIEYSSIKGVEVNSYIRGLSFIMHLIYGGRYLIINLDNNNIFKKNIPYPRHYGGIDKNRAIKLADAIEECKAQFLTTKTSS